MTKPRHDLVEARNKWLDGLNPTTAELYERIFSEFWMWARRRYTMPPAAKMDWTEWLIEHRRLEVSDHNPNHCEDIVSAWVVSLKERDFDLSTIILYTRTIRSFFRHLLPRGRGRLHLPKTFPRTLCS